MNTVSDLRLQLSKHAKIVIVANKLDLAVCFLLSVLSKYSDLIEWDRHPLVKLCGRKLSSLQIGKS